MLLFEVLHNISVDLREKGKKVTGVVAWFAGDVRNSFQWSLGFV